MVGKIVLKPGREKSLLRHHPWIFSGAIASVRMNVEQGEPVSVLSHKGEFLAWADYNPKSQIAARIWSWDENQIVNASFLYEQIDNVINRRRELQYALPELAGDAMRLVYAEADGLPGLIVDQYGDQLVMQFLTAGSEYWRDELIDVVCQISGINQVYERSDVDVRQLEGLPLQRGVLRGQVPPRLIEVKENNLAFFVDVAGGHKTGFYLDQRVNRQLIQTIAKNADVLDCFCYSGGFTCAAVVGGANTIFAVDSSGDALEMAQKNLGLNGIENRDIKITEGDVFQVLRQQRDRGMTFDLIILDPPKFAHSQAQVEKAARGYKDINLLAFKLLRPGGLLATFSCSGNIDETLFQKIIAGAALDANVNAQVIRRLQQAPDHPVALHFPESAYLKGLLIQRVG